MKYRIYHKETGQDHGVYEGSTPTEAIVNMHQDAGYPDVGYNQETDAIQWPSDAIQHDCNRLSSAPLLCGEDCWQAEEMPSIKIVIDHERYGDCAVFKSLKEAEQAIRDLGPDWASAELHERPDDKIVDERGEVVGYIKED